tara:strand:+ start:542 stop:754 length:213 start_codon:yes stop_codon:yes gene_type:complete
MGAKHPMDLINKLGTNKNEFIIACSYLVRMGIVNRPGDAIRYMESKELSPQQVFEKYNESQRTDVEESND